MGHSETDPTATGETETEQIALEYFESWSNRRGPEVLRELMAEDFTFRAGDLLVDGREPFLEFGGWPDGAVTELIVQTSSGSDVIQIYRATNAGVSVTVADHLKVDAGLIRSSDTICDGATFEAFASAG